MRRQLHQRRQPMRTNVPHILAFGDVNGRDEGFTKLLFDDSPAAGSEGGHAGRGHGNPRHPERMEVWGSKPVPGYDHEARTG
jgi:hypothetical protein